MPRKFTVNYLWISRSVEFFKEYDIDLLQRQIVSLTQPNKSDQIGHHAYWVSVSLFEKLVLAPLD